MKVIIPVAGKGTRTRPHTLYTSKPLLFVAGKKVIEHILDSLVPFKDVIEEVIFIIGENQRDFKEYITSCNKFSFPLNYAIQPLPLGLGDAVARGLKEDTKDVLILLGDTIAKFKKNYIGKESFIGVMEVENPKRFGIVEIKNGFIINMEEKPENPKTNLAIAGVYYIKDSKVLYQTINTVIKKGIKTKGEIQLTDALRLMCENGYRFKPVLLEEWYDCGTLSALLKTNRKLLLKNFTLKNNLYDSFVIPPVWIHPSARIEESIIGPFVSIDKNCLIKRCNIRDSIINQGSEIVNCVFYNSISGTNSKIKANPWIFNLGPFSNFEF